MTDEPEYKPTSNPCVFLRDGKLYVKNDDGAFSPFPYEEEK
jgi:hypothetical protein